MSSITYTKSLEPAESNAGEPRRRGACEKMCPARCAMCFIGRPPDVALGAWAGSPRGATPRRASPRKFCESCISVHALPRLVPTGRRRPGVCSLFVTFGLKSSLVEVASRSRCAFRWTDSHATGSRHTFFYKANVVMQLALCALHTRRRPSRIITAGHRGSSPETVWQKKPAR